MVDEYKKIPDMFKLVAGLPPFSGGDFAAYMDRFSAVMAVHGIGREECGTRLKVLMHKLDGAAFAAFAGLPDDHKSDFDRVVAGLKTQFATVHRPRDAIKQLGSLRWSATEP